MHRELDKPPGTATDPNAFELLRVWAAGGEQHVTIHSELEGGAEDFGYMLAQLARHGANLYARRERVPMETALRRIRDGFDAEWEEPTSWPTEEG